MSTTPFTLFVASASLPVSQLYLTLLHREQRSLGCTYGYYGYMRTTPAFLSCTYGYMRTTPARLWAQSLAPLSVPQPAALPCRHHHSRPFVVAGPTSCWKYPQGHPPFEGHSARCRRQNQHPFPDQSVGQLYTTLLHRVQRLLDRTTATYLLRLVSRPEGLTQRVSIVTKRPDRRLS